MKLDRVDAIENIMLACKASGMKYNLDEVLLKLVFRTDNELIKICNELCIKPKGV